jgi:hypothetical protein
MLTWIGVMKAEYCPSWEITLAPTSWLRLDSDRERGPTMRTQEARPLWVGITLGLLYWLATYLLTCFMIEDVLAQLK